MSNKQWLIMNWQLVIDFWFNELQPKHWWVKDAALDELIRERFSELHRQAMAGELSHWREIPLGRLGEVIILDQFSRNMYRDTPRAFASDALALVLSQEAVRAKADLALGEAERQFLYMPYMHSESAAIHEQGLPLFAALGDQYGYGAYLRHQEIVTQFGRYPHRNAILGRVSSVQEEAFLQTPNSSF